MWHNNLRLDPDVDVSLVLHTTFRLPIECVESGPAQLNEDVDWICHAYMPASLSPHVPHSIVPLKTTGDGNCLLHAVSKAIWGAELYSEQLRQLLVHELTQHLPWYVESSTHLSLGDWEETVSRASSPSSFLDFTHIFALANAIRRPIILYAGDSDVLKFGEGEVGIAATFLPSRLESAHCAHLPLSLCWQSRKRDHFVPLIGIEGRELPLFPPKPGIAFPSRLGDNVPSDYVRYDAPEVESPLNAMLKERREQHEELLRLVEKELEECDRARASGERVMVDGLECDGKIFVQLEVGAPHVELGYNLVDDPLRLAKSFAAKHSIEPTPDTLYKITNAIVEEIRGPKEYSVLVALSDGEETPEGTTQEPHRAVFCFSRGDDPYDAAREFITRHHLDMFSNIERFASVVRKTVLTPPEDVPSSLTGGVPAASPALRGLTHLPKLRDAPILYRSAKLDLIRDKLFAFAGKLEEERDTLSFLCLSSEERDLLSSMVDALMMESESQEAEAFSLDHFNVMHKLLRWPKELLFPVLDLARSLVLHPSAQHHLQSSPEHASALVLPILMRAKESGAPPWNAQLAFKFCANLFATPEMCMVAKACHKPIVVVSHVALAHPKAAVRQVAANTLVNLCCVADTQAMQSDIAEAIHQSLQRKESDASVLFSLLVALGTLCYHSKAMRILVRVLMKFNRQTAEPYLKSTDDRVSAVTRDMMKILEAP